MPAPPPPNKASPAKARVVLDGWGAPSRHGRDKGAATTPPLTIHSKVEKKGGAGIPTPPVHEEDKDTSLPVKARLVHLLCTRVLRELNVLPKKVFCNSALGVIYRAVSL